MNRAHLFLAFSSALVGFGLVCVTACGETTTLDPAPSSPAPAPVGSQGSDAGAASTVADAGAPQDVAKDGGGGGQSECTGPAQCSAGAPICCATIQTGPGSPPMCSIASMKAVCTDACKTEINKTCEASELLRLCAESADCTEPGYPSCCRFTQDGTPVTFCAPKEIEAIAEKCF